MTVVVQTKIRKTLLGSAECVPSIDRSSPPNVVQITRLINWLMVLALGCATAVGIICLVLHDPHSAFGIIPFAALFALFIWLVKKQNDYRPIAWRIQIVFFVIGLLMVPSGTIISGFLLWAWFKPETKAWFGCSKSSQRRPGA